MNDAPIDLDAYRRRIGLRARLAPTLEALCALVERHAAAIAFENIDVLAGRVPRLDPASLQAKLVQSRRGGYCFEQNALMFACLRQAGFAVRPLEARVRAGAPADVVTGRTHRATGVDIDGTPWLVDVGFGSLAATAPLNLAERGVQRDAVAAYRFVDVGAGVMLQCETHDGWTDCYRLMTSEPEPIDFEIVNWWVATHPSAFLRHNLLVARSVPAGRLTLFNDKLSLRGPDRAPPQERTLGTRAEIGDALADAFDLGIDEADLDAVMALLERRAAAPA